MSRRAKPAPAAVLRGGAAAVGVAALVVLVPLATASAASAPPAASAQTSVGQTSVAQTSVLEPSPEQTDPLTGLPLVPSQDEASSATSSEQDAAVEDGAGLSWVAWTGIGALLLVSLGLTAVASTTLAWMLHAWRTPEHLMATRFDRARPASHLRFSLLVPARHEEEVLGDTLDRLAAMEYDDVEVIAIVGDDDPGTTAVAREAAARNPGRIRVVVDDSVPKNKPKALNTALRAVTGDVVGVMDAEDEVHPLLLTNIASRFAETGADVVQGGVQLMNVHSSWWSMRNCLEYYFWFRSRLHFHAGARFIPLGGNTVFLRTDQLHAVGGWDAECLAEDCEIGVRLSSRGARVAVAYDPEIVTREETPGSMGSLLKQRTRWNQGFLQVLRKEVWRELPTRRQRALARYTLSMPFLQAFTGIMIPISVALILFAQVPVWVSLLTFLPLVPTLVTLAVEAAGLDEFGRAYGVRVRLRDQLLLLLGTFPYQVFLAAAAVRAVVRERRGQTGWEKTSHSGAHRTPAAEASPVHREAVLSGSVTAERPSA